MLKKKALCRLALVLALVLTLALGPAALAGPPGVGRGEHGSTPRASLWQLVRAWWPGWGAGEPVPEAGGWATAVEKAGVGIDPHGQPIPPADPPAGATPGPEGEASPEAKPAP